MKTGTNYILSSIQLFTQYKTLGEKALAQIDEEAMYWKPEPESNNIYLIIKHLSGNMKSRWTDFLTTDGEKPWRNRDDEFMDNTLSKEEVLALWQSGWDVLLNTLKSLTQDDLASIVYIRGEAHSVMEAINRQVAHYAYHIGQIVLLAKATRSEQWQTLSIAKGKSNEFNADMHKK